MIQSARTIAFKPDPGTAFALGPAGAEGVAELAMRCRKCRKRRKPFDAAHPMAETAENRTRLPVSCWHCLRGSSYFQYGAQKYQMWRFMLEAPQGGLDPKSETRKLRTVSREERN